MPKLVVYVPAGIWRRLERMEGPAVKDVARSITKQALLNYTKSVPGDDPPSSSSGSSGVALERNAGAEN